MFSNEASKILGWTTVASRQFKEAFISVLCSSHLPTAECCGLTHSPWIWGNFLTRASWRAGREEFSPARSPGIPRAHVQEAAFHNCRGRIAHWATGGNTHSWDSEWQRAECASFIILYVKEHPSSASRVNESPCSPLSTWNKWEDKSCQQNRSSWAERNWTGSPTAQWSSSRKGKEKHHYRAIILKGENKRTVCFTEPSKLQKKDPAQPSSPLQTIEIWAALNPLSSPFSAFPEASALRTGS